ncbi:hypothetical protein BLNAU_2213 [Blattamonas nauphoetae]|uniref:Yeast cell wall synthesis Kre9/Knh1-like N-terminal domain-containing protein n=1 Tax=Blattamonas nauphoetae TaxID=2049346 RepID=A0ABQ9YG84_9EUKA|nr:hypothetical protein BLNAU_2213 [Blattamonas nauphoetae]
MGVFLVLSHILSIYAENEWKSYDLEQASSRKHHSFTFINGDGYSFGGFDSSNTLKGDLFRYTEADHALTKVADFQARTPLRHHASVWYKYNGNDEITLPTPMHGQSMATFNASQTILIWGGAKTTSTGTTYLKKFHLILSDGARPTIITPAEANDIASVGTSLAYWKQDGSSYLFLLTGGQNEQAAVNQDIWLITLLKDGNNYSVSMRQVHYHPVGLPIRSFATSFIVGSNLIIYGGSSSTSEITVVNLDSKYFSWSRISPSSLLTPSLTNGAATAYDSTRNTLVTFGGEGSDGKLSTQLFEIKLEELLKHSNCIDCTTAGGIWCASLQRCLTKGVSDPEYEQCSIQVKEQNKCPSQKCSSKTSCSACLSDSKCGWCQAMEAYPYSMYGCFEGSTLGPSFGNCFVYTQNNSKCSSLSPTPVINEPRSDAILFIGTSIPITWYTQGDNLESVRYNVYLRKENEVDNDILMLYEYDASAAASYHINPTLTPGRYSVVFKMISPTTLEEQDKASIFVTLSEIKAEFTKPKAGDQVTDTLDIAWKNSQYLNQITLVLQRDDTNHTIFLFNSTGQSSYKWNINPHTITSGNNYKIAMYKENETDSTATPKLIGTVGPFSISVPTLEYRLLSPTPTTEILPGREITISWETNIAPEYTSVSIKRGNAEHPTSSKQIASFIRADTKSIKWVVDVDVTDTTYFFRIEEGLSKVHVDSHVFPLQRTSLVPTLQMSTKDYTVSLSEKTTLKWDYYGPSSMFRVDLVSSEGVKTSIVEAVPMEERQIAVTIPMDLVHGSAYLFCVTATETQNSIFGYSQPFVVVAPGAVAVLAIPSIVFTSIIAVCVAGFAVAFHFLCVEYFRQCPLNPVVCEANVAFTLLLLPAESEDPTQPTYQLNSDYFVTGTLESFENKTISIRPLPAGTTPQIIPFTFARFRDACGFDPNNINKCFGSLWTSVKFSMIGTFTAKLGGGDLMTGQKYQFSANFHVMDPFIDNKAEPVTVYEIEDNQKLIASLSQLEPTQPVEIIVKPLYRIKGHHMQVIGITQLIPPNYPFPQGAVLPSEGIERQAISELDNTADSEFNPSAKVDTASSAEIAELRAELETLKHEKESLQTERDTIFQQLVTNNRDTQGSHSEIDRLRAESEEKSKTIDRIQELLGESQAECEQKNTDLKRLRAHLNAVHESYKEAQESYEESRRTISSLEQSLDKAKAQVTDIQLQLRTQQGLDEVNAEIDAKYQRMSAKERVMRRTIERLDEEIVRLKLIIDDTSGFTHSKPDEIISPAAYDQALNNLLTQKRLNEEQSQQLKALQDEKRKLDEELELYRSNVPPCHFEEPAAECVPQPDNQTAQTNQQQTEAIVFPPPPSQAETHNPPNPPNPDLVFHPPVKAEQQSASQQQSVISPRHQNRFARVSNN